MAQVGTTATGKGLGDFDTVAQDFSTGTCAFINLGIFSTLTATVTDNKPGGGTNTFIEGSVFTSSSNNTRTQGLYCLNFVGGASHVFHVVGVACSIEVLVYDDVDIVSLLANDGAGGSSGSTSQQLTFTPSEAPTFAVLGVAANADTGTYTCDDTDIPIKGSVAYINGNNVGSAIAAGDLDDTSARTPTLGWSSSADHAAWYMVFARASGDPALTLTAVPATILNRVHGTSAAPHTISGTYVDGDLPTEETDSIEYQVKNATGDATRVDWTLLTGSPSGGTYSVAVSLPVGTSPCTGYNIRTRTKNSDGDVILTTDWSTNYLGVGEVDEVIGQSNAKNWQGESSPAAPTANTLVFDNLGTSTWVTPVGNGVIEHLNQKVATLGMPCGLIMAAVSSTGLVGDGGQGHWTATGAGTLYQNSLDAIATATRATKVANIIICVGETDAAEEIDGGTWLTGAQTLYGRYRTALSLNTTQLPFGIIFTGPINDGATLAAHANAVRHAQQDFLETTTGVFYAGTLTDGQLVDAYHYPTAYYGLKGKQAALCAMYNRGDFATNPGGPKMATAYGTQGSAVIDIVLTMQSGGTLTEVDGTTNGTPITNIEFSDDNFATTLTISSTSFTAGKIRVTLSAAPGSLYDAVLFRYQDGLIASNTAPIYDGRSDLVGTRGFPVQPTNAWLSVVAAPSAAAGGRSGGFIAGVGSMMGH